MVSTIILIIAICFFILGFIGAVLHGGEDIRNRSLSMDEHRWYRFGFHQVSDYLQKLDREKNGETLILCKQKYNHFLLVDKYGEVGIILWEFKMDKNYNKTKKISEKLVEHYKSWDEFKDHVLSILYKDYKCPEKNQYWKKK